MKRITFLNKSKQLYYYIEDFDNNTERNGIEVLILLNKPTKLYYDDDINGIEKNVVADCRPDIKYIDLVKDIMKSNTTAVQYLNFEHDEGIADLAQLKVSYNKTIKPWNIKWRMVY